MTTDLARCRELIAKATPGPLRAITTTGYTGDFIVVDGDNVALGCIYANNKLAPHRRPAEANAELFAAARTLLPELVEEVERLRDEDELSGDLIQRQGKLLTGVVNAIRGEPKPLHTWSHHDAPELAAQLVLERDLLRAAITKPESFVGVISGETAAEMERLRTRIASLAAMVEQLRDYTEHQTGCPLTYWEATEPNREDKYKYRGVWMKEPPACECGLSKLLLEATGNGE